MEQKPYPSLSWSLRWELIKDALKNKGHTLKSLGAATGVTGLAAVKNKRYPSAQEVIAEALGVPAPALFPDRYNVRWSDDRQKVVESVLPGLGSESMSPLQCDSIGLLDLQSRWRAVPVSLYELPVDQRERLAWIKNRLKERGFVLALISRHLGVKPSAVNNLAVVAYSSIQSFIAKCLGVLPQQLWPERYTQEGLPLGTGKAAKALPNAQVEPYALDLSHGLWLPIQALAGLPGLPLTADAVLSRARRCGWPLRRRADVTELPYACLPAETQHFLTGFGGRVGGLDTDQAGPPKRKRHHRRVKFSDSTDAGHSFRCEIDVLSSHARVGIECLNRSGEVVSSQGVDVSAAEMRKLATVLLEVARTL